MNQTITASDVKIKTVSIEIKTMVIEKRQVTLSVFRQLPIMNIFDDNFLLLGKPWGKVNYFPEKDDHYKSSINLVWQSEDRLNRCVVHKSERHYFRDMDSSYKDLLNKFNSIHKFIINFNESVNDWNGPKIKTWGKPNIENEIYKIREHSGESKSIEDLLKLIDDFSKELVFLREKRSTLLKNYEESISKIYTNIEQLFIAT